jgi:hypothetical protein
MKIKKLFYLFSTLALVTSCATTSFYQVYNVKPVQESISKTDELFFEDDNCKISYNLWSNGGNIGFEFYNKTDEKIYINLNETNFILNGFAYDYYKNRTFTTSESNSASTSNTSTGSVALTGINVYNDIQTNQVKSSSSANLSSSVGYAVSIKEDSIIYIPAKTTKTISEYSINKALIRNCDLFKYPSLKNIKTKSYAIEQSPIVFSNIITYNTQAERITVENKFFVSEITNYPFKEFFEFKYDEYCGDKSMSKTKYYKFYDIDKFYVRYNKGRDLWKH